VAQFRYLRDPLFMAGSGAYALNRFLLKPNFHSPFLHNWFNDLLLVPCAIPVVLWLFRIFDLRLSDDAPAAFDLIWILTVWSLLFEWVGPRFVRSSVADWRDVVMYWVGGVAAWLFWRWQSRRRAVYHEL
jgi:hypothetical protein